MRHSVRSGAALLIAALLFSACQSVVQAEQKREQIQRHLNIVVDRQRIFVTTGDLKEEYSKLGDLSYTEPLTADSIDSTHINEKLRRMAIAKWGDQVDAIIRVSSKPDADATTLTASGEAVSVKGDCAFCRHGYQKSFVPPSEQQGPD
ncbi:MAG TPA: hypothetical protein VFB33_17855 [Candidatus Binataceae bacterium]|nr:hypothetical protein [Candidatus Binataceae bacterium]